MSRLSIAASASSIPSSEFSTSVAPTYSATKSRATSSHEPFPVAASRVRPSKATAVTMNATMRSQPTPVANRAMMARTAPMTSRAVQMSLISHAQWPMKSLKLSHQLSLRLSWLAELIWAAQ